MTEPAALRARQHGDQREVQTREWLDPCLLPAFASLVDDHATIREAAAWLQPDGEYRSETDCVLGAFVPEMRGLIGRYYAGQGPRLAEMTGKPTLRRIDEALTQAVPLLVEEWLRFKREFEAAGGSSRAAADAFVKGLVPLFKLEGDVY